MDIAYFIISMTIKKVYEQFLTFFIGQSTYDLPLKTCLVSNVTKQG